MTAKEKMIKKIQSQTTETLKQSAELLMGRYDEGTTISFVFILAELETRMPPADFQNFCDNL